MILAINTSTLQFSLALLEADGSIMAEHVMAKGKGHFGGLIPSLQFLLSAADTEIRHIEGIAVATGPGSYTGLRVGLAAAKGLCHALEVSLVGVPSLLALANQVPLTALPIVTVLESRRGELFVATYRRSDIGQLEEITGATSLPVTQIPSLFQGSALVIGTDFSHQMPLLRGILDHAARFAPSHCWVLRASSVGDLALDRFRIGDVDDPELLTPLYLRSPDIRPNPFQPDPSPNGSLE